MSATSDEFDPEAGTFLAEICADLGRAEYAAEAACPPGAVWVEREVPLAGAFADIRVAGPGRRARFIENKLKYTPSELVVRFLAKYGRADAIGTGVERVSVVMDTQSVADRSAIEKALAGALAPGLSLDIWDVDNLLQRIQSTFECEIHDLTHESLRSARAAIERAHWRRAFDGRFADYSAAAALLWHFSPWELSRLHHEQGLEPGEVLHRAIYADVIIVMADLCSFSSYVRDTPDPRQIGRRLTEFYSLARHAVLNAGGMLYQFVGDEVVGLFGLHEPRRAATAQALRCVRSLFDAGNSVSQAWQRNLDRVQPSQGLHIGIGSGNLNLLPLRPYSHSHIGFIGDGLNLAARLMTQAASNQVVVSNRFHSRLEAPDQALFEELEPIEARNVGRIRAFRTTQTALASRGA